MNLLDNFLGEFGALISLTKPFVSSESRDAEFESEAWPESRDDGTVDGVELPLLSPPINKCIILL